MVALSSHYHYHHHYQHHYHQNRHHHHPRHHHHHLQHDWWLGGGTTALIALIPLFIIAFLLYSGWSRLKQVAIAKIMAIIGKRQQFTGNRLSWLPPLRHPTAIPGDLLLIGNNCHDRILGYSAV